MTWLRQNFQKKEPIHHLYTSSKKCELFSHLAFSNFTLAPFICLQLSILLPSCRRAEVAMAPGTVETKLVQVAFAAAVDIIAQTGSGGNQAGWLSRSRRRPGERCRIGELPDIAVSDRLPDLAG